MHPEEWHYAVAIWVTWPSLFPEYTETILAVDHLEAIEMILRIHEVRFSPHVAVALCGTGGAARYARVFLAADGLHVSSLPVAA